MHRATYTFRKALAATAAVSLLYAVPGLSGTSALTRTASAATLPSSCASIAAARPGAVDGNYLIFAGYLPVSVYCAQMASAPAMYLNLQQVGGNSNVSFRQGGGFFGPSVTTTFSKVRLLARGQSADAVQCQAQLCVVQDDFTFSTSTGGGSPQRYADAYACNWWGAPGTANVDLRGTLLKVPSGSFGFASYAPSIESIQYSANNQVVNLRADGLCGEAVSTTAPLLPLVARAGTTG